MSMSFLGMDIGDITGTNKAAKGAERAADAQIQSAQQANALQRYMYDTTREDFAPWRDVGANAIRSAGNMLTGNGFDYQQFMQSPQYKMGLEQGLQGVQRQLAASGLTGSGAALKAVDKYGQNYANQQFGDYYNRLMQLSGAGQQATGSIAGAGQNYAQTAGNNLIDMGNARGSAYIARGNTGVQNFNSLMQLGKMAAGAFGA